jgi:hypothetical protein
MGMNGDSCSTSGKVEQYIHIGMKSWKEKAAWKIET